MDKLNKAWHKWMNEGISTREEALECVQYIRKTYDKVERDVQLKFDRDLIALNNFYYASK